MADIRPFAGIRYAHTLADHFSDLIAPPYDVLDESAKMKLLARHPKNIVSIDLPHLPPKTAGPDAVYERAAGTLNQWLEDGTLHQDTRRAFYPYAQSYDYHGKTYHRRGLIALVKLTPFGQDVIPHERTYKGPIEDRMMLMRKTGVQLSPIFGLFSDPSNLVTQLLFKNLGLPERRGVMDGVQNDLWSISDADVENQIVDLFKMKKIYIADGHHRYTTALQYQFECQQANGGPLPPNHPANFCMFVLVSMQDPGLIIQATHRILGGLYHFDIEAFGRAVAENFDLTEVTDIDRTTDGLTKWLQNQGTHSFGVFDGRSKKLYSLTARNQDPLAAKMPEQSQAWRQLDVSVLQHYLLDSILQPQFSEGQEINKAYTADPAAALSMTDGDNYQLALLMAPTPLAALEQLGQHGEVMPQKSTYFFPKLATGMVINPLR